MKLRSMMSNKIGLTGVRDNLHVHPPSLFQQARYWGFSSYILATFTFFVSRVAYIGLATEHSLASFLRFNGNDLSQTDKG
jgi:hypothetical protein